MPPSLGYASLHPIAPMDRGDIREFRHTQEEIIPPISCQGNGQGTWQTCQRGGSRSCIRTGLNLDPGAISVPEAALAWPTRSLSRLLPCLPSVCPSAVHRDRGFPLPVRLAIPGPGDPTKPSVADRVENEAAVCHFRNGIWESCMSAPAMKPLVTSMRQAPRLSVLAKYGPRITRQIAFGLASENLT
jgi:hypothetical protein